MPLLTLLSAHDNEIDITGPAVRAAGYYGVGRGLHTVQLQTRNLRGIVILEGTLVAQPDESDWFAIALGGQPQLVFPRQSQRSSFYGATWPGESATIGFTFNCNCLYLRVRLVRSHLIPPQAPEWQIAEYGAIDSFLVKY